MVETTQWPLQKCREKWRLCSLVSDDGLSQFLIQEGDADENCIKGDDIQEQSTSQSMENENRSQNELTEQFCKFPQNEVDTHPESQCHNRGDNHDEYYYRIRHWACWR